MSRQRIALALTASLFLISSAALAEPAGAAQPAKWTDAVCNFADQQMLAALHLEKSTPSLQHKDVEATPGGPTTKVTLCTVTSSQDGVTRVLALSASPFPAGVAMPPSCSTQTPAGMLMAMCFSSAKASMLNAQWMGKNDDEGQRQAAVFRTHFERRAQALNK